MRLIIFLGPLLSAALPSELQPASGDAQQLDPVSLISSAAPVDPAAPGPGGIIMQAREGQGTYRSRTQAAGKPPEHCIPPDCWPYHKKHNPKSFVLVKEGQTLKQLADEAGMTVSELMKINGLESDELQVFQKIYFANDGEIGVGKAYPFPAEYNLTRWGGPSSAEMDAKKKAAEGDSVKRAMCAAHRAYENALAKAKEERDASLQKAAGLDESGKSLATSAEEKYQKAVLEAEALRPKEEKGSSPPKCGLND